MTSSDLTQQFLARLWAQAERPQGKKLQRWLFTPARNAVVDAYRRQKPQVDLQSAQDVGKLRILRIPRTATDSHGVPLASGGSS